MTACQHENPLLVEDRVLDLSKLLFLRTTTGQMTFLGSVSSSKSTGGELNNLKDPLLLQKSGIVYILAAWSHKAF